MKMVQTQPLQTKVLFFLGKLLKNKRTEKIYDFKSVWVLVKVKLLKTNLFYFSVVKDAFKMSAKRDQTIPVYKHAVVPCRTYGTPPLPWHRDQLCEESARNKPQPPWLHHTWPDSHGNSGMNSCLTVVHHHQHTQERQEDKIQMSGYKILTAKLLEELGWTSIQTGIH